MLNVYFQTIELNNFEAIYDVGCDNVVHVPNPYIKHSSAFDKKDSM